MTNRLDDHVIAYQGESLYDFDNNIILHWYPQRILMNSTEARSILELGLGHGFTASIFSEHFDRHVVLEGSPAIIQNFKERFPECETEIIETYFEEFDTEERFDVIVMGFILEHVDNPLEIISRYKKFLSPEGKLFLAVPNAEVLNRRFGYFSGLLEDMQMLSENDHLQGHKRYYTVASLTDEVNEAGCQVDMMEGLYLKPFTTSQIVSLNLNENIIRSMCEVGIGYPELSCGILAKISSP